MEKERFMNLPNYINFILYMDHVLNRIERIPIVCNKFFYQHNLKFSLFASNTFYIHIKKIYNGKIYDS